MGICLSAEQREQNQRSAHIDKMITDDASKIKKECKILLLGSGESGKSTIVKQMKIIHQNGYKQQELERFKSTVAMNIVDSTVDIALAMDKFKIIPENPKAKAYCEFLIRRPTYATKVRISSEPPYKAEAEPSNSRGEDAKMGLSAQWLEIVETVWSDPARIRLMDEQSSNFYIMDNAPYFFENIKRIAAPDYIPTEEDVLRSRQKTTGITETRFTIGQLQIHMFDVGGQRSERKKWIHCFEGVTSIIFCVGLSEYDQMLLEEANQNRMQESLVLFESIINSRWFLRTSFILFLNKIDLFKAKLKKIPLNKYFPEYDSGPDVSKAAKYILWKFTQANRAKLSVYPHLTQATDTSNIRLVFAAVKETLLQNALKASGMM